MSSASLANFLQSGQNTQNVEIVNDNLKIKEIIVNIDNNLKMGSLYSFMNKMKADEKVS